MAPEERLQIIQIEAALREEVMKELREIQGKSAELAGCRVAAQDQMKRVEIRSPSVGCVHQLAVAHGRRRDHAGRTGHANRAGRGCPPSRGADHLPTSTLRLIR